MSVLVLRYHVLPVQLCTTSFRYGGHLTISALSLAEEVKAWNAMKARSETSELDSEDTSEASECDSDHQSSGSSVSAVDISDAESCSEFEQVSGHFRY